MTNTEASGLCTLPGMSTLGPDLRNLSAVTSGSETEQR